MAIHKDIKTIHLKRYEYRGYYFVHTIEDFDFYKRQGYKSC